MDALSHIGQTIQVPGTHALGTHRNSWLSQNLSIYQAIERQTVSVIDLPGLWLALSPLNYSPVESKTRT